MGLPRGAGVWDKGLAAGSVVGSCWERLEDTSPSSSNSPNGSLGTATKGPSAPGRRQDQDPQAPRAGPMSPQSQAVSSAWRYPRALLSQWLLRSPMSLALVHSYARQSLPWHFSPSSAFSCCLFRKLLLEAACLHSTLCRATPQLIHLLPAPLSGSSDYTAASSLLTKA